MLTVAQAIHRYDQAEAFARAQKRRCSDAERALAELDSLPDIPRGTITLAAHDVAQARMDTLAAISAAGLARQDYERARCAAAHPSQRKDRIMTQTPAHKVDADRRAAAKAQADSGTTAELRSLRFSSNPAAFGATFRTDGTGQPFELAVTRGGTSVLFASQDADGNRGPVYTMDVPERFTLGRPVESAEDMRAVAERFILWPVLKDM